MSRYIITRRDQAADAVVLESEGLTIGRLGGNDLVLNHPTVSRTHAGIRDLNGDYWISNLSEANGTLLNGEALDNTPLADGDVIQIGPFILRTKYEQEGLAIAVEMSVNPLPIEGNATGALTAQDAQTGATAMLSKTALLQRVKPTPKGTRRLAGTGLLTGLLPQQDQQALKIFWDKRKREAGKLAEQSPLQPRTGLRSGKAQFNWRPTRDLQRPWPVGLFAWAAIAVTALCAVAAFAYKDAYSPGALASPHHRAELTVNPAFAVKANAGACMTCHSPGKAMIENCAACHTTDAFHSEVSARHMQVGLRCTECHGEHKGRDFNIAATANTACTSCHREGMTSGGVAMKTPHGGTLGYPVQGGEWKWAGIRPADWQRRELPGEPGVFSLKDQFHMVHVGGSRRGRANCSDCHTAGFAPAQIAQGVRESCASCHAVDFQTADAGALKQGGAGCVSCHAQHGEEKDLRAALRRIGRAETRPAPAPATGQVVTDEDEQ
ncbi:MAG: FHA domain-containing protein [Blastocatellia bacterium]